MFGIALITEPAGCKRPSPWYRKALDSFLVLVIFPSLLISGTGRVSRETVAASLFHLAPAPICSVIGAWCVVRGASVRGAVIRPARSVAPPWFMTGAETKVVTAKAMTTSVSCRAIARDRTTYDRTSANSFSKNCFGFAPMTVLFTSPPWNR